MGSQCRVGLIKRVRIKEDGQRIAAKLEQATAVGVNLFRQGTKERRDQRRNLLGTLLTNRAKLARERRETGEIGEEDRAIPEGSADSARDGPLELRTQNGSRHIGADRGKRRTQPHNSGVMSESARKSATQLPPEITSEQIKEECTVKVCQGIHARESSPTGCFDQRK